MAAAAVLALLGTSTWLALSLRDEREQAAQRAAVSAESESATRREVERLTSALREQQHALAIALSLSPGIFRGGGTPTIAIPADAGTVSITRQTDVPPMAGAHTVILRRESGDEVRRTRWVLADPNPGATVVMVPTTVLSAGRYLLEWSIEIGAAQAQTVEDYAFIVRATP